MHRQLRSFSLFISLFLSTLTQAQFVPDQNLRDILNGYFPGLVDESGIVTDPGAYVYQLSIVLDPIISPLDLTGLEYVSCGWFSMDGTLGGTASNFPSFPVMDLEGLIQLDHFSGPELPPLPPGLGGFLLWQPQGLQTWYLNGGNDGIPLGVEVIDLPASSPWAVTTEFLGFLNIVNYPHIDPPILGPGVENLDLWIAPIMTSLPSIPSDMVRYYAHSCDAVETIAFANELDTLAEVFLEQFAALTSVSGLPAITERLTLSDMPQLNALVLPPCSGTIDLRYVPAEVVTELPPTLEEFLYVGSGLLQLSMLPPTLTVLSIAECEMPSVPNFPDGIERINLSTSNDLTCIPWLPPSVTELFANGLPCYPNQPPLLPPLPLCTILNSHCPEISPSVSGHVFYDVDGDGEQGPNEPNAAGVTIVCLPTGHMTGTNAAGDYNVGLPIGAHELTVIDRPWPFTGLAPDLHQVQFVRITEQATGKDFSLFPPDGFTIDRRVDRIQNSVARPGFQHDLYFDFSEFGFDPDTTVVTITFDPLATYGSTDLPMATVEANVITARIPPFTSMPSYVHVRLYLEPTVTPGIQLTVNVMVGPLVNDVEPENNVLDLTYPVLASFDPNDKQVFPHVLTPDEVASDTTLEYLIRFQNTGTYLAERVLITDTLDADLRWDTFRFLQSSHACDWFMRDGVAHFVFNDIMLPDSTSNEADSHGFVRFSIRPSTDLANGATVSNEANIYFDFNVPVITDPTVLTIDIAAVIALNDALEMNIYPNPVMDRLFLDVLSPGSFQIELLAADGRVVLRSPYSRTSEGLDVRALRPGMYVARIQEPSGRSYNQRFIKH